MKRMNRHWLIVWTLVILVVVTALDLAHWHGENLAILYTVPVFLSSFVELAVFVVAVSTVAVLLDLLSVLIAVPPTGAGALSLLALLIVGFLALKVAGQRALIRRQAEEAARNAWNQMLLAEAAHELRTPLTVILGYAQVLLRDPRLPASLRGPVALIEKSALQMRDTIDDFAKGWKPGHRDQG
jgi:signal transduction histidine kinase